MILKTLFEFIVTTSLKSTNSNPKITTTMILLEEESVKLTKVQRLEGPIDMVWGLDWNPTTEANGVYAIIATCCGDKTIRI